MLTGRYRWTVDNTPAMGEFEARCDEGHITMRCLDGL